MRKQLKAAFLTKNKRQKQKSKKQKNNFAKANFVHIYKNFKRKKQNES